MIKYLIISLVLIGCNEVKTKSEMIPGRYTSIGNFICETTVGNKSTWLKVCIDTKTKCEYISSANSHSSFILIEGTCKK
jgi:hypothetical protein